jgi:hypothetical protein
VAEDKEQSTKGVVYMQTFKRSSEYIEKNSEVNVRFLGIKMVYIDMNHKLTHSV